MPDDGAGVIDAVDVSVNPDISSGEPTESTVQDDAQREGQDKTDNRRQPDALRKHIADLRRQADGIQDPAEKKAALDRIKMLYDTTGKARGYEEQFPTVREAREVKALLESVGGREGVQQMQSVLSEVEQIDQALAAGDASVIDRMWQEAPEGMPKLVPHISDKFEREKPQEYQQFIAPRSVRFLDQQGFPQAFDRMVQMYEAGKTGDAQAIRDELIKWVVANRTQAQQQQRTDPEVERLRQQLAERERGDEAKAVDTAYNSVVDHAGPEIDRVLRPLVGKLGLTGEQYKLLRGDVWNHLQDTRNSNDTYKTVAPSKQRQGYDAWTAYAKRWTSDNVADSARAMVKARYGNLLQNGAKPNVQATQTTSNVLRGKEPAPSEIDYGQGSSGCQKGWDSETCRT